MQGAQRCPSPTHCCGAGGAKPHGGVEWEKPGAGSSRGPAPIQPPPVLDCSVGVCSCLGSGGSHAALLALPFRPPRGFVCDGGAGAAGAGRAPGLGARWDPGGWFQSGPAPRLGTGQQRPRIRSPTSPPRPGADRGLSRPPWARRAGAGDVLGRPQSDRASQARSRAETRHGLAPSVGGSVFWPFGAGAARPVSPGRAAHRPFPSDAPVRAARAGPTAAGWRPEVPLVARSVVPGGSAALRDGASPRSSACAHAALGPIPRRRRALPGCLGGRGALLREERGGRVHQP